jgi:hypothetical protein
MTENIQQRLCAKCSKPILDEYLTIVMDQCWHEKCLQCSDCGMQLTGTCYARHGNIYCREDFYRYVHTIVVWFYCFSIQLSNFLNAPFTLV